MAFALPSYNAAVASAQTSGLPLQRLQAGIDFDDVKSEIATKMLGKQALEKFITEANIAKQALDQYGATLRTERTLEANKDLVDKEIAQKKSDNTEALALQMLTGGLGMLGDDLLGSEEKLADPRAQLMDDLLFRQVRDNYLQGQMGGLDPSKGLSKALNTATRVTPQMRAPGTNAQIPSAPQVQLPATPKIKTPTATESNLFRNLLQMKKAGSTTQTK